MSGFSRLYVFGNFHIALGAVSLLLFSCFLLDQPATWAEVLMAYSGTWFIYCYQRWLGAFRNERSDSGGIRHDWTFSHKQLLLLFSLTAAVMSGIAFFYLREESRYLVAGAGAISVLYSLPLWRAGNVWRRLRDITGVKIVCISLVWAVVCALLPAVQHSGWSGLFSPQAMAWSLVVFLFIFYVTLPFDIRDMEFDKGTLRSIPMIIGLKNTRGLIIALMIASVILSLPIITDGYTQIFLVLWLLISGWISSRSAPGKSEYFYSFGIDGLLLFPGLYVLTHHFIQ